MIDAFSSKGRKSCPARLTELSDDEARSSSLLTSRLLTSPVVTTPLDMSSSTSNATASQSPLISIPQKTTTEADLATPVRSLISASYGEDPKKWIDQTNGLNRARQDAVRGAGTGEGKGKGDAVGAFV